MRRSQDRRNCHIIATYPLEDSNHEAILEDRRTASDRRFNDMSVDERQMLLSEMPGIDINSNK